MKRIEGILVPMVTPLRADFELDYDGLERLVEHLIAGGCAGLFPLGTTGGGPFLPMMKQMEVNRAVCRFAAGRLPVLTGVSAASPEDSVALGRAAREAGSAALVAAPPCYLPLTDAEIAAFYTMLAERTQLPVFVYNMPGMTKINMKPALLAKLAEIPGISGYKDSSKDMNALHEVLLALKHKEDFPIFVGPDTLMAETVILGGAGGVNAGANLFPEIFVKCREAARRGDLAEMMRRQEKIDTLRLLYKIYPGFHAVAMGLKTGLKLKGICGNAVLPPLLQPDPALEEKVAAVMRLIGEN